MTFNTIMQAVAKNAGINVPSTVGGNDPDVVKLRQFINEAGCEIARRVDWSAMRKTATLTGTGSAAAQVIATDFDRLARGMNVVANGDPVRGSLTQDEWFGLDPVEGAPRFYYLAAGQVALWPFLAAADTARVLYQSVNWAAGDKATMDADTDTALFSDDTITAGAIWRWRRHIGKDYADQMAEFEAMLADRASFDGGVRQP